MTDLNRISVIIPVYNTAAYVDACLDSVVAQSWSNLQILIVDDGSTDGSGEICDRWAQRDGRIQVIHQKNSGVSAARNVALDVADGAWISFVDSDDVLLPDAYSHLLETAENAELIMGKMALLDEQSNRLPANEMGTPAGFSLEEFLLELFLEARCGYLGYLSDKLFRREIIEKHRIRFDSRIRINEDRLFLLEYLLGCENIVFCNQEVYGYRQRSGSAVAATRGSCPVAASEMTVLLAFEAMAGLAHTYSDKLYYIVCRRAFNCGLHLLGRTRAWERAKRLEIRKFTRKYAGICVKATGLTWIERAKIVIHCLLER